MILVVFVISDIIQLDSMVVGVMIVFWLIMMFFDLLLIIRNKKFLKYENSIVLNFFVKKMKLPYVVLFTILCEGIIVILSPFVFIHKFDIEIMGMVSVIVGIIHIDGLYKTRKFIIAHNI